MSADFRLRQLTTGPFNQNSLILSSSSSCAAVVVDPGAPVADILHALSMEGLQCREIWLTHSHFDNCGAAAELKRRTGAIIRGHRAGERFRRSLKDMAAEWELDSSALENCPEPDEYFVDRQQLRVASCEVEVIFTPGHSPDHVSFYAAKERLLLCGDTLYEGAIAPSNQSGGDHSRLLASIRTQFGSLPGSTRVIPAHYGETTLAVEFQTNPFLLFG